jgi:hypothetical protein
MRLPMYREFFGSLPSLHGANVPAQVGSDLLPPTQVGAGEALNG